LFVVYLLKGKPNNLKRMLVIGLVTGKIIISTPYGICGSCMDEITFSALWHDCETDAYLLSDEWNGSYNCKRSL